MTQLSWLRVGSIVGIVDSLSGPYSDMAILSNRLADYKERKNHIAVVASAEHTTTGCRKSFPIGRDMTAVHFEVFLLACAQEEIIVSLT